SPKGRCRNADRTWRRQGTGHDKPSIRLVVGPRPAHSRVSLVATLRTDDKSSPGRIQHGTPGTVASFNSYRSTVRDTTSLREFILMTASVPIPDWLVVRFCS